MFPTSVPNVTPTLFSAILKFAKRVLKTLATVQILTTAPNVSHVTKTRARGFQDCYDCFQSKRRNPQTPKITVDQNFNAVTTRVPSIQANDESTNPLEWSGNKVYEKKLCLYCTQNHQTAVCK